MKPREECLYYLVREMGGGGVKAKAVYFDDMLEHVWRDGLKNMSRLEIRALVMAAEERNKLDELDAAVRAGRNEQKGL